MQDLIDKYIAERVARGEFNGDTPKVTRSILIGFAQHTVHLSLEELSELDVESWIAKPELKPATRNSMVNKLKPFIRWMVARDHIPKDFTVLMRAPKVPPGMPRYLTGTEVRALVRHARTSRDRLIVLLMVHLGLRRIEVSRINIGDIDFRECLISIRGKNGLGEITRVLPIDDEVHGAMLAYLGESPTFTGPLVRLVLFDRRMSDRQVGDLMAKMMLSTGVKKTAHDGYSGHALRHTCAQDVIDGGWDIRQVQAMLGHTSVTTTEKYLRRKPPGLREAMGGRTYG